MDIALKKKAHLFRLPSFLLDKLKDLAQKDRRSLNNYVEGLLMDAVYPKPDAVTIEAPAKPASSLIYDNIQKIRNLCEKYKVKTLSVFGSVLTDRFNDKSDVDFLVDFEPYDPENVEFDYLTNYLDLADSLEALLDRKIDLVVEKGMRNKYFIANVNRTKQLVYG